MTSFFKAVIVFCLAGFVSSCSTAAENAGGAGRWITLFDGQNVDALRGYKQQDFPEKAWTIDNGALKTVPGQRVDLISRDRFKDFELELEWKVSPGGNSGVFYGVQETEGPVWHTGPEMQVLDDSRHKDGQTPNLRAGSLYAMIAPGAKAKLKPVGEFNKARVVAKNGQVEHWLNGEKIVEYDWNSPEIKQLIANSKFKKMPRFMQSMEGHIALQHHGEEAWFRNVRIRRL